jgi:hypothetical protein
MTKRLIATAVGVLLFAGMTFAAGNKTQKAPKERTYVGVITDTNCGTKGHMGPAAECVKKCVEHGAKYALAYKGKVYVLEPQDAAAPHAGAKVRVKGTMEGMTIHATSIEAAAMKKSK